MKENVLLSFIKGATEQTRYNCKAKRSNLSIARVATCGCGEMADALDLGSSGRPWGFKSLHPHQFVLIIG